MLPNREVSIAALYYHAHCDLCLWNQKYLEAINYAKLANAAPSQITAQVLFIGLMIKWRKILSTPQSLSLGSLNESVEEDFGLLHQHAQYMEEYYQPDVFHFLMEKTSFHLRSSLIEDELPPKAIWPTQMIFV